MYASVAASTSAREAPGVAADLPRHHALEALVEGLQVAAASTQYGQ
jgi:hypothetical protein